MHDTILLSAQDISHAYAWKNTTVPVLQAVTFEVRAQERVAILGRSGSGKSTLLSVLGGLMAPTQGQVLWSGQDVFATPPSVRAALRNTHMGFVFQHHHLMRDFTAEENVAMPLWLRGVSRVKGLEKARAHLDAVGLAHRLKHHPHALSGGERQRVALARALVGEPAVLLADEPTGNLDPITAHEIMALIEQRTHVHDAACVLITHDPELASGFQQHHLEAGVLIKSS